MSTPANLIIKNLKPEPEVVVSNDGDPATMLRILSEFYGKNYFQRGFEGLEKLYLNEYKNLPEPYRGNISKGRCGHALWQYEINASSNLTIACFALWNTPKNSEFLCDPLDYLQVVTEESKAQVAQVINGSTNKLRNCGVKLLLPNQA